MDFPRLVDRESAEREKVSKRFTKGRERVDQWEADSSQMKSSRQIGRAHCVTHNLAPERPR